MQTPERGVSKTLRQQGAEVERLRRDNFNKALRINFLEEQLLGARNGTDFRSEELEREQEVHHAKEANDMLNAQLHEAAARAREEARKDTGAQQHEFADTRASGQNLQVEMAEMEHWKEVSKQREEQLTALKQQVKMITQEKQTQAARYRAKFKRMEEQLHRETKTERLWLKNVKMRAVCEELVKSLEESQREYHAMKESNRLLVEEAQERRRSANHTRKKHTQATRDGKVSRITVTLQTGACTQ